MFRLALVLTLVAAISGSAVADEGPPRPAPTWGLAGSVGGLGGLGLGPARSAAGLEGALWVGRGGHAHDPTRAIGVDAGWTTHAEYVELEASAGWNAGHDGETLAGLAMGPVHDRARGRWGGQATAFIALVPCPIFPYVRAEKLPGSAPALSIGLMVKVVIPIYPLQ